MSFFLGIIGVIVAFFLMKKRESVGDLIGDAPWMSSVGGPYNVIIIVALLVFFWSVAAITGTQDVFLKPILWLFPSSRNVPSDGF